MAKITSFSFSGFTESTIAATVSYTELSLDLKSSANSSGTVISCSATWRSFCAVRASMISSPISSSRSFSTFWYRRRCLGFMSHSMIWMFGASRLNTSRFEAYTAREYMCFDKMSSPT